MAVRIIDVTGEAGFRLIPPCADAGFDHRTCDYWEDADRGSKAARLSWLEPRQPEPKPTARVANPFAPPPKRRPPVAADAPRKLGLLARGLAVFGSYAKLLLVEDVAVAYSQFGPLSAYPRALRLRELYPQLPDAPLPAVITCIATTADARRQGHARRLVDSVCDDLAERGFAAVEAFPERGAREDT